MFSYEYWLLHQSTAKTGLVILYLLTCTVFYKFQIFMYVFEKKIWYKYGAKTTKNDNILYF